MVLFLFLLHIFATCVLIGGGEGEGSAGRGSWSIGGHSNPRAHICILPSIVMCILAVIPDMTMEKV